MDERINMDAAMHDPKVPRREVPMDDMVKEGLEGVVVAATKLSEVDGQAGRLSVGGFPIEELAGRRSFEWVVALLHDGAPPDEARERELQQLLGEARVRVFERGDVAAVAARAARMGEPMAGLRAAVATLDGDLDLVDVVAAVPVFVGALGRARRGGSAVTPDAGAGHAADYLRMVSGAQPDASKVAALDAYLVTVVDHGLNASTFTARVVASTGSDRVSAVTAAIGALKGPLHGGAPGPVLDMLDAVEARGDAAQWLRDELAAGRRIMGMGHRIYRVRDPRADVLERALASSGLEARRLEVARRVERAASALLRERYPERALATNVEFFTAVLLDAVGLERSLFAPTFAVGRVAGWCAHVDEQRARGRLVRPESIYVGPRRGSGG
jgi:citrate synthase